MALRILFLRLGSIHSLHNTIDVWFLMSSPQIAKINYSSAAHCASSFCLPLHNGINGISLFHSALVQLSNVFIPVNIFIKSINSFWCIYVADQQNKKLPRK